MSDFKGEKKEFYSGYFIFWGLYTRLFFFFLPSESRHASVFHCPVSFLAEYMERSEHLNLS